MNPWLSVIIPTFNGEQFLNKALQSLPSHGGIELIAIDDGSSDRTIEILENFPLPKEILRHSHTGNWVANTNEGLRRARGTFVSILHQDDEWLPNRFSQLKKIFEENPTSEFIFSPSVYIGPHGRKLGTLHCPLPSRRGPVNSSEFFEKLLVQNFISMPAPVFRRESALALGGFDENLWYTADWDLWLKFARRKSCVYLPEPFTAFRLHPNSQTVSRCHELPNFERQMRAVYEKHDFSSRTAEFSIQVNTYLAGMVSGQKSGFIALLANFLRLGPAGWKQYFTCSRILERSIARLKINSGWLEGTVFSIFILALGSSLYFAQIGWKHSLSGPHGFRQAQTAITVSSFLKKGALLRYETPVLGPPWSIPMEFPLYQGMVAAVAFFFKLNVIESGRWVGEIFFYLSLLPFWGILSLIGIRSPHRFIFLTFFLVSPEYLFWSRSVMIESTALFFGMSYLWASGAFLEKKKSPMPAILFGVMAALVKITTFYGFLSLVAVWAIARRRWLAFLFLAGVPILSGATWVEYSDAIKSQNPFGTRLTSHALRAWNFGTLAQRFEWNTWRIFFFRIIPDIAGSFEASLLALLSCFLLRIYRKLYFVSLGVFLLVFLTFTHLHWEHNYYSYANGIFLLSALSFAIVEFLQRSLRWRLFGLAFFVVVLLSCIARYQDLYYPTQSTDFRYFSELGEKIRQFTKPDEVLIGLGLDWSSEVPFYAERKALLIPDWPNREGLLSQALDRLQKEKVGALVICGKKPEDAALANHLFSRFNFDRVAKYRDQNCVVFSINQEGDVIASWP